MLPFPIHWPLQKIQFLNSNQRNQKICTLHLNHEWNIVYAIYDTGLPTRIISSIEIHREGSSGKFTVSGELKLMLQNPAIQVWHKRFSKLMETGCSSLEMCSHVDSKFIFDGLYNLSGYVIISEITEKPVIDLANGDTKEIIQVNALKELSSDFRRLLDPTASCFADITLKCDGFSIPAHKSILSARSPVFEAMFTNPMKESLLNEVDIDDMDVSILQALLIYMYTGKISVLSTSTATDLMFAADKYQLLNLIEVCSYFLKDTVDLQNVARILVLGDMHSEDLKSYAVDFICNKWAEFSVLEKSEEWKTLENERPALVGEVLTSLKHFRDKKGKE